MLDVPFIAHLIHHNRLAVTGTPCGGVGDRLQIFDPLDRAVGNPRAGIIIKMEAVVDTAQMIIGILFAQDGAIPFPIRQLFGGH